MVVCTGRHGWFCCTSSKSSPSQAMNGMHNMHVDSGGLRSWSLWNKTRIVAKVCLYAQRMHVD